MSINQKKDTFFPVLRYQIEEWSLYSVSTNLRDFLSNSNYFFLLFRFPTVSPFGSETNDDVLGREVRLETWHRQLKGSKPLSDFWSRTISYRTMVYNLMRNRELLSKTVYDESFKRKSDGLTHSVIVTHSNPVNNLFCQYTLMVPYRQKSIGEVD